MLRKNIVVIYQKYSPQPKINMEVLREEVIKMSSVFQYW